MPFRHQAAVDLTQHLVRVFGHFQHMRQHEGVDAVGLQRHLLGASQQARCRIQSLTAAALHHLVQDDVPFPEAERLAFGVDHATVGGWLAESWSFPAPLVEAISCHHHPERAGDPTVPRIVQLCDLICLMQGIGCGADGLAYEVPEHLLEVLGLDAGEVSLLAIDLATSLEEIDALAAESVTS